MSITIKVENH